MKTPNLLFWGLALALAGCSSKPAVEAKAEEAPPVVVNLSTVTVKDIADTLPVDGTFVLAQGDSAKLAPVAAGKLLKILAREGDHVTAGQLLAVIDTRVLAAQSASAASGAAAANSQAMQSEASLRAAQADYASNVKVAKLALESAIAERDSNVAQAKIDLQKLRAGARPQELAQAEQVVTQAQLTRDKAKQDADRDASLLKEGYVSGQQADASRAAYKLAESALAQAKSQLDLVKAGARKEDLKAAELRLQAATTMGDKKIQQARATLEQAKQGQLTLDAKSNEVTSNRLLAAQKASDATASSQLAKNGEIRAPFAGTIGRRFLNSGDSTDPMTPVFEIARKGAVLEFLGTASPTDAVRLAANMAVTLTKDQSNVGRLTSVGAPDNMTGLVPIRAVFPLQGSLPGPGSHGTVRIITRRLAATLALPAEAIITRDGQTSVFVVEGGIAHLRPVTTGPTDGGFTAITKGVKKGETVVLLGQHELSDGAKVEGPKTDPAKADGEVVGDKK